MSRSVTSPPFGRYPSAIERRAVDGVTLWVKRDDALSDLYGGNKVRKLERLLPHALARGKSRVVTLGAAGSHQVVAAALFAKTLGLGVDAVLVPQPDGAHARANLRVALGAGAAVTVAPAWALAPVFAAARLGTDSAFIPLGGSSSLGSLGFVDAALEVEAAVMERRLPPPDVVVVATGSGGTAAGLAVGFQRTSLNARVVGVAVSPPASVLEAMTRRVLKSTAQRAGLSREERRAALQRLSIEGDWIGDGYGLPSTASELARLAAAASHSVDGGGPGGLVLDPSYTAKAFACAISLARRGLRVLFWNTFAGPFAPGVVASAPDIPERLECLFTSSAHS